MEQVLDGIASEQVCLEQDVSFINHKGDVFIWIDTQLDQLAAYFVERVVCGHDLDGGMTFDIFSYYFPFPTSSIDTQQQGLAGHLFALLVPGRFRRSQVLRWENRVRYRYDSDAGRFGNLELH